MRTVKEYQHLEYCLTPDDEFHWLNLLHAPETQCNQILDMI